MGGEPRKLGLARDLLDKLLVDEDGLPLGRVDGVVLVCAAGAAPRVAQLESGTATLIRRLGLRFARRVYRLTRRLGFTWRRPVRIEWREVAEVGRELCLKAESASSPLLARERWLRDHVIRRIPGHGMKARAGE